MKEEAAAFDRKEAKILPLYRPGIDHAIELLKDEQGRDMVVPASPLFRRSKEELLLLRKALTELLDINFIQQSSLLIASPVLFIKKADGSLRFCYDYRKLNALSRRDAYLLLLIQEILRMIALVRWVSKVDVISAFYRIRVREGNKYKTAFTTWFGIYEWLVTPFGLTGAPATFQ